MKTFIVLLLFCHTAFPAKYSLKYILAATSGMPDFPEFLAVAFVNNVVIGYCDNNMKRPEFKTQWMTKVLEDDPQHLDWYINKCIGNHHDFRATIESLKQRFNKSVGVHIFQRVNGCEWDDKTEDIKGFNQYGYNGEDFITLDLKTLTWVARANQAVNIKHNWDKDGPILFWKNALTNECPDLLKKYVTYGKSSLQSTVLPSVSLLQKSPSSPVSCHATGFYPDRADLFWRKDGEEIHEDVDHGEILPNHDGTFQMSVDLDISSVKPEDWSRYDCVFQLSGVKNDVIIKLDKDVIRTNWGKTGRTDKGNSSHMIVSIIVTLVVLCVIIMGGFTVYKKKKAEYHPTSLDKSSEVSEKLNPES